MLQFRKEVILEVGGCYLKSFILRIMLLYDSVTFAHKAPQIKGRAYKPIYNLCAGQIVLPPSPPGSPGVRENMRLIKKGGTLEKRVILVII